MSSYPFTRLCLTRSGHCWIEGTCFVSSIPVKILTMDRRLLSKTRKLLINPYYTQYKKAPTFAIGCDCTHRQPSEKEHLYESRKVYRHGRSSGHHLRCRDGC